MTVEYVLLLVALLGFGIKAFMSAPADAFREAGPRLGARIERQISTGTGFKPQKNGEVVWKGDL